VYRVLLVSQVLKDQQDFKVLKEQLAHREFKDQQARLVYRVLLVSQVLKDQQDFKVLKEQLAHQVYKEL
jgi:hypothetical protein